MWYVTCRHRERSGRPRPCLPRQSPFQRDRPAAHCPDGGKSVTMSCTGAAQRLLCFRRSRGLMGRQRRCS